MIIPFPNELVPNHAYHLGNQLLAHDSFIISGHARIVEWKHVCKSAYNKNKMKRRLGVFSKTFYTFGNMRRLESLNWKGESAEIEGGQVDCLDNKINHCIAHDRAIDLTFSQEFMLHIR
jgi:hypothetical protein